MREGEHEASTGSRLSLLPSLILWTLVGLQLVAILLINNGHLAYTLDDPYIHLALAENLISGHYGVNPGEASAPSSSILWPVLLAPFTLLPFVAWVPLLLNLLAATLTLRVIQGALLDVLGGGTSRRARRVVEVLTVLSILATNQIALIFFGMEHSLQVLCAVLLVRGVVDAERKGFAGWGLLAVIVLGPLVRYENAALSVAALLWLWWSAERGRAMLAGGVLVVAALSFSIYLSSIGLSFLPTSVLAKHAAISPGGGVGRMLHRIYYDNLSSIQGLWMSLGLVALLSTGMAAPRASTRRRFALSFALGTGLFLMVGRVGWHGRYESCAWTAELLVLLHLWGGVLRRWVEGQGVFKTALISLAVVGLSCREYVVFLAKNPLASHNIYLQHFQMHRYAVDFLDEPVAVNDLGWVAFENDNYVLDLWGLASIEALRARGKRDGPAWMTPLVEQHLVRVAMIYDDWFPEIPQGWKRLGELRMAGTKLTVARPIVAFYATQAEAAEELLLGLRAYESTLPDGATFVFD